MRQVKISLNILYENFSGSFSSLL